MCQNRCKPFILKGNGHFREGFAELQQELVHIGCGLRMRAVQIERIAHNKFRYGLAEGVILKIIYYLCSRYGFDRRGKDAQRIALRDPHPGTSVVYSYNPFHKPQI